MRKEWETYALGEVSKVVTGNTPPTGNREYYGGPYPFVSPSDMDGAVYLSTAEKTLSEEGFKKAKAIPKDAILFTCIGSTIGKLCISQTTLTTNQQINSVVPDSKKADSVFLYYVLAQAADSIKRIAGTQAVPIINKSTFEETAIDLPPLPEQQKIAVILRTWDEAIEKLEKLKQQRKKLFNQRRRQLTDITSGHGVKFRLLSEISKEINRRNDDYDAPVMMISSTQGFIRQDANYDREMAGESLKKYIYLKEGEFAYNKGNSKTYPYGCIFRLEVPDALIPFVYICFKLDDKLNAGYFRHYFEAGSINRQLIRLISSSVRGNGLLNIGADDFFSCRIPVPDRSHQDTCANFLDAATKELAVLDAEISFIKNQKRGLMQKLLTGEWRVRVDDHFRDVTKMVAPKRKTV